VPNGDGSFSAANGRYATSAPKPNDAGTYHFLDNALAWAQKSAAQIVLKQLATRYGRLSAAVAARVQGANTADLDAIAQRVLTAQTLDEALGTR
jgi:hypothetical protein